MGLSVGHLLVVLAIVVLVFGTKRLKNVGSDLGESIKAFKKGLGESSPDSGKNPEKDISNSTADNK